MSLEKLRKKLKDENLASVFGEITKISAVNRANKTLNKMLLM
ncbi:hypothetical protein CUPS9163_05405 [Campylobacter upsaliensis]|nr:hypothetical protein [Campylobacter upsaliensis]MCR2091744.1 hypothetical protein [Campylobacter upsaliensis]MCR2119470.1 hypothetical protein [Campylobacter upsaliensis]MEB2809381.1 hypothetical protein [Campylobacter upsaliensis]MEB2828711.1 hypothetical protein [Campylobacter upsaliensis]